MVATSVGPVAGTEIADSSSIPVTATETPTSVVVGSPLPTQPPAPSTTVDPLLEQIMAGLPLPPPSTINVPPLPSIPPPAYSPPMSIPMP